MIKAGISLTAFSRPWQVVQLVRMLNAHPDVDIVWMHNYGRVTEVAENYPALTGEFKGRFVERPDLDSINLYIGNATDDVRHKLAANPDMRAIFTHERLYVGKGFEPPVELGFPEYNRKALVRGARTAYLPDQTTILGGLALMPLAKNLLLSSPVTGAIVFSAEPGEIPGPWGRFLGEHVFEELNEQVLQVLQTSFAGVFHINSFSAKGNVSMATFNLPCSLSTEDVLKLFHDFYDDHRHVVVLDDGKEICADMIEGTNKAVISPDVTGGILTVSVAFDATHRLGAGSVVHLLDLLFGLDELTGF